MMSLGLESDRGRRLRLVFLSHTPANSPFVVGSHHLSRELAALGHDVLHMSTATSLWHVLTSRSPQSRLALRNGLRGHWGTAQGVRHVVPTVLIPPRLVVGTRLGRLQARLSFLFVPRRIRSALREADFVLVDQPTMVDFLNPLRPQKVIYRPTDAHPRGAGRRGELVALQAADAVIATGRVVLDSLPKEVGRSLVIQNGVDYRHFANPDVNQSGRGFIYVGALDRRFDWGFVRLLAQRFPDEPVVLAGPSSGPPQDMPSNVRLVGSVSYAELPALLKKAAVGLLPFSSHPSNDGRSPMKYYEYLASGLFILATKTPELARREDPGVKFYSTPDDASFRMAEVLLEKARISRNSEGVVRASDSSWQAKAVQVGTFLREIDRGSE